MESRILPHGPSLAAAPPSPPAAPPAAWKDPTESVSLGGGAPDFPPPQTWTQPAAEEIRPTLLEQDPAHPQAASKASEALNQALTLAEMHAQIPGEFLIPELGAGRPADPFREAARLELGPNPSQGLVELTALTLFEQSLATAPRTLAVSATPSNGTLPGKGLAASGVYTGHLVAALSGGAGGLTPAVVKVLEDFRPELLFGPVYRSEKGPYRTMGRLEGMARANDVAPSRLASGGVMLRGVWAPVEAANLELAIGELKSKQPQAVSLFHSVELRTVLGEMLDGQGRAYGSPSGLAGGQGVVGLSRASARHLDSAREVLFHEVGHELDAEMARRKGSDQYWHSRDPATPFGKSSDRKDYVSDYAMTDPQEDFAETHAHLLLKWEAIQAFPDACFHARGAVGEKLRYVLEQGYGGSVPPPSPRLAQALERVRSGDSPFGWKDEQGKPLLAERDFQASVNDLLSVWDPRTPPPEFLFMPGLPDGARRRWVAEQVLGIQVPEPAPPTAVGGVLGGLAPAAVAAPPAAPAGADAQGAGGFVGGYGGMAGSYGFGMGVGGPVGFSVATPELEPTLPGLARAARTLSQDREELDGLAASARKQWEESAATATPDRALLATLRMVEAEQFRQCKAGWTRQLRTEPGSVDKAELGAELGRFYPPEELARLLGPGGLDSKQGAELAARLETDSFERAREVGELLASTAGTSLGMGGYNVPVAVDPVRQQLMPLQGRALTTELWLSQQLLRGGKDLVEALRGRLTDHPASWKVLSALGS